MVIKFIDVAGTMVPNVPLIWYREEQILPTFEYCDFINKDIFIDLCQKLEFDYDMANIYFAKTEFSLT
ncbi:MAG: hypothetical protein O7C56_04970, partial [Rickettsia endosymbiont of Ixodes persulcatus]|nr:hypothetical protein [Rickettsia endosymbiont of Ixodes persulcatus]